MATKDFKIILSKNKKICANSEKSDTRMGVYLKRFCDPKKINVYEFIIGQIEKHKISLGIRKVEVQGTDYNAVLGWRFSLDQGTIDHAGEEK